MSTDSLVRMAVSNSDVSLFVTPVIPQLPYIVSMLTVVTVIVAVNVVTTRNEVVDGDVIGGGGVP